jgi:hypothetical protein
VTGGKVEVLALRELAHLSRARDQGGDLARAALAAVAPERRVLDPEHVEQLERLRVVPRRHLDFVALLAQTGDDRTKHQRMRRCRHVNPNPHRSARVR